MSSKSFPTLYKLSSKGKIQVWDIEAGEDGDGAYIITTWGQQGKKQQETTEEVNEGKNIGKSNETTPFEQAVSQAESTWKKKKDSGYAEDIGDTKSALKYLPMLAHKFRDYSHKLVYPCYVQPKLNGGRNLAIFDGADVRFQSRKQKIRQAVPHLVSELQKFYEKELHCADYLKDFVLDGELYVHGSNLQHIMHCIERDEPDPDSDKIELHLYDCFFLDNPKMHFKDRWAFLNSLFDGYKGKIKLVDTFLVDEEDEISNALIRMEKAGFEGCIARNAAGVYAQNKRSTDLIKVKSFIDEEFEITGMKECTKGRFKGMGVFTLKTEEGASFDAMPTGTAEQRKEYWDRRVEWPGQWANVKFFDWSVAKPDKPSVPQYGCVTYVVKNKDDLK